MGEVERTGDPEMSLITDVAIIAHDSERDAVWSLCSALPVMPDQLGDGFKLDSGTKAGSFAAWGGAFNYLDWEDFCEAVTSAPCLRGGDVSAMEVPGLGDHRPPRRER